MLGKFAIGVGVIAAIAHARNRSDTSLQEAALQGVAWGCGAYAAGRIAQLVSDEVRAKNCPRVFMSYHHGADSEIKEAIATLGEEGSAGFEFEDVSVTKRIRSRRGARIRADLTRRVRGADKVLVVIGKQTHARRYVHHELDVALEEGKPIVAVKLGASFKVPPQLYGSGVQWAGPNAESIRRALRRAT